jgi:two-component system cell cycle sensor histidine kinase/response regulator CckA
MSNPLRVLVIEDNEDDALLLLHALRQGGYEPVYKRVEEADAMLKALHSQKWDVVISDYVMPHFGAPDALELLKKQEMDIPFIIVSGAVGEETAVLAMKAGAHDYIRKDNYSRLIPAIERELREVEVRRKQKQAEEDKKKIQAQFFQSQKLEAIGRLTGGVAHDFNNILTAIQGFTDLAMGGSDVTSHVYNDLRQIQVAVERAASLTRQLLIFSRRQPMNFLHLDLNKTVENLIGMLHRIIGEEITITCKLASGPLSVFADKTSVEQMVMNLVVNAKDAMPQGGEITLKTEKVTVSESDAKGMAEARSGKFIRFSVIDRGTGMDPKTLEQIFEPFFSTKGTGKGSGLGLSVVYGIVQQHKGWLRVSSEVGKGSVFEVYLPRSNAPVQESSEPQAGSGTIKGNGERILVIEDEAGVRQYAVESLERNGYTVFAASGEKEALDLFKKEMGDFDLIFSDVVLPDTNGIDLVEQLLKINPSCKVLFSSGYSDQKSRWKIIQKMGYPYLQKPYELNMMLVTVRDALAGLPPNPSFAVSD